jgi:transposase
MKTPTLFPDFQVVRVERMVPADDHLVMVLTTCREVALCPRCQQPSWAVHSRYRRNLTARPWNGIRVCLQLLSRRWFCRNPSCPQRVFTERLPELVQPHRRRTEDTARWVRLLAYLLGGEAGARAAADLGFPVSADTLLRELKRAPKHEGPAPSKLGVDDFAFRRGRSYGTLLVDLESGQPIELLPDRKAETVARWLQEHPGAEIVSRDGSPTYAEAIRQGAPGAVQVADRFHLAQNLVEGLVDYLRQQQPHLTAAARAVPPPLPAPPLSATRPVDPAPPADATQDGFQGYGRTRSEREQSRESRARRVAWYEAVKQLQAEALDPEAIAQQLGLPGTLVLRYMAAAEFPERKVRNTPPGSLEPYRAYLEQRWAEGCYSAHQLWKELKGRGYRGCEAVVYRFLGPWREQLKASAGGRIPRRKAAPVKPPTPKAAVWKLLGRQAPEPSAGDAARDADAAFTAEVYRREPQIKIAVGLTREFLQLLREHGAAAPEARLRDWTERVERSGIRELQGFCAGLRRDWKAVVAAMTLPWSNGVVEGQVNRLKLIKRQMYGRGSLAALRARVLPLPALMG